MENESKESFINSVFKRMKNDTAFCAAFKRADNPDLEYQCWEYLADLHIPELKLDNNYTRLPYVTVFSAMAKSKQTNDGSLELGKALCDSYDDGVKSQPARMRLRRLISCDSTEEVCAVLRPILQFIISKEVHISFEKLLADLNIFNLAKERITSKWAQQFYGTDSKEEDGE